MLDRDKSVQALQVMDEISNELHREFSRQVYEMTWRGEYDLALEMIHDFLSSSNPGIQENRWFFVSAKAFVLSRAGRLDQCIQYAETELENLPEDQFHLPNISGVYCSLMNTIGSCLMRKGRMNEAMERFKTVIAAAQKYHHENELAVSYANTGALLISQNPTEAMSFLNKAESLAAGMDNHQLRALIFGFMGECELALENYDEAEFFLVKELNIAKELGSPSEIKHATSHLNHLYDKMNIDGFSEKFFKETMDLVDRSSPFDWLWFLEQQLQVRRRETDNVRAYHSEALKARKEAIKEKNPYFVATFCVYFAEALYFLSREYDHEHNLKHARQELKQAIRLFRKGNYKRNLANTLKFLGSWERRTGQYEYCLGPLEESIELYETLHDHESVSDACTELGLAQQSLGNIQQAIAHLEKAVEQYERNYRGIRKPGLKTVFFGEQRQVPHRNLLSLYVDACMPEQAWLTVQKIRGRSLLIMLSTSGTEFAREDFSSQDMFECYQEFRVLENDQNILWEKWQKEEMQNETEISGKIWDQYAEGEIRYQELFLKLENEPKFNFIRSQKPVSYVELRELIGK